MVVAVRQAAITITDGAKDYGTLIRLIGAVA